MSVSISTHTLFLTSLIGMSSLINTGTTKGTNHQQHLYTTKYPKQPLYPPTSIHNFKRQANEGSGTNPPLFDTNSTSTTYTEAQISCAERLGVDLNECNAYGVYQNRTEQIASTILNLIATFTKNDPIPITSWDNVTATILKESVNKSLNVENLNITTLKPHDFNGLTELHWIHLHDNKLEKLPDTILDNLNKIQILKIDGNPLVLSENFFKNSQQKSIEFCIIYNYFNHFNDNIKQETPRIIAGNSTLFLSEIAPFFSSSAFPNSEGIEYWYLFPAQSKLPNTGIHFTKKQQEFLCTYFPSEIATLSENTFASGMIDSTITGSGDNTLCKDQPYFFNPTQEQLECARNLSVNTLECNALGVFINRTQVINDIISVHTKNTPIYSITPENLLSINHTLDFNNWRLGDIPIHAFHGLKKLRNLHINTNRQIQSLYNTFTNDLPNLRKLFIWQTNITFSTQQFQEFQKNNPLIIFYQIHNAEDFYPRIMIDNGFVKLSSIKDFFESGVQDNLDYLKPSQQIIPDHLNVSSLSDEQKAFLNSSLSLIDLNLYTTLPTILPDETPRGTPNNTKHLSKNNIIGLTALNLGILFALITGSVSCITYKLLTANIKERSPQTSSNSSVRSLPPTLSDDSPNTTINENFEP